MNLLYVKIIGAIIVVCGIWYNGYSVGYSKLTAYKLEQETVTREKETQYQSQAAEIRKAKDAQINSINNQLVDAISQLRKRNSRTDNTSVGQTISGCNGSQLYAEDAEFLIREAARADTIKAGLEACYKQYDSLK